MEELDLKDKKKAPAFAQALPSKLAPST